MRPVTNLLFALGLLGVLLACGLDNAKARSAQVSTCSIRGAAQVWRLSKASQECPTLEQLVADKTLQNQGELKDPWGKPFQIKCTAEDIEVFSSGPDSAMGTADDLTSVGHCGK